MPSSTCCFDGCREHRQQFPAFRLKGKVHPFRDVFTTVDHIQPVQRFRCFFLGNLEFGNEILAAAAVNGLCDIRSNACPTADKLIGQNKLMLLHLQILSQLHDASAISSTFFFQDTISGHIFLPAFRYRISNIFYLISSILNQ